MPIDRKQLPDSADVLQQMVLDLIAQLDASEARRIKTENLLRQLLAARSGRRSEQISEEQLDAQRTMERVDVQLRICSGKRDPLLQSPKSRSAVRYSRLFALLLFLPFPSSCQVAVDWWTAENGLPQNVIRAICQTPDGYLWLATFDGLVRFDGVRFLTFDRSNTPGLSGNRFTSLFCTAGGDLWEGNEGSGVVHYHQQQFTSYTIRDGLVSNSVSGLASDDQGNIWALAEGWVHRWNPSERRFVALPREKYQHFGMLAAEGHSGFARISDKAVQLLVRGQESQYPLPAGWPSGVATGASLDFNNNIWLGNTTGSMSRLVNGQWTKIVRAQAARSNLPIRTRLTSEYRDSQGNIWKSDSNGMAPR